MQDCSIERIPFLLVNSKGGTTPMYFSHAIFCQSYFTLACPSLYPPHSLLSFFTHCSLLLSYSSYSFSNRFTSQSISPIPVTPFHRPLSPLNPMTLNVTRCYTIPEQNLIKSMWSIENLLQFEKKLLYLYI